ncbi:hypothetical protein FD12_GL002500 [Lentilactobacillus rapi DSM 19907 = JCM 15042]|uniref:Transposase n=1 Tax=Lentilactobacillus rapi DSM 19907 = JCM 15042 TaxID=1423795 RepID=A0ABR5PDD6_9LACO|nr:hypothetical protein FD12_GL002500 [Lentilactobacillus rapi DSM 19907 = JCM 15042]
MCLKIIKYYLQLLGFTSFKTELNALLFWLKWQRSAICHNFYQYKNGKPSYIYQHLAV